MINKKLLHIDIDNFFISVEKILDKTLDIENSNIVIASSEDNSSIVLTSTYSARKIGINAGMPIFKAKKICKNLIIIQSKYEIYMQYSKLIYNYIKQKYSNVIEMYSIDEWFIDITNKVKNFNDAYKFATKIQQDIKKHCLLNVSIGISYTKFLAKNATNFAKPAKIFVINESNTKSILNDISIKDIFLIGKKTYEKLKIISIYTVSDFLDENNSNRIILAIGKTFYDSLVMSLIGYSDDYISNNIKYDSKSFSFSTTQFSNKMLKNNYELHCFIKNVIDKLYWKIFLHNKLYKCIFIKVRFGKATNKWKTFQYSISSHSNSKLILYNAINHLINKNIKDDEIITGLGMGITNILDEKISNSNQTIFKSKMNYDILKIIKKVNSKLSGLFITTLEEISYE